MSNGIGANPLNAISKVYLEQIAEKKDDSYLEPDMKKRQKNNEKARKDMEKMGTSMKNPHFEEKQQGWDAVNTLADAYKEMHQVDEADSLAAMQARREKRLAAQRKREGTTASGRDFGHDYSLTPAQQKARRDAEFKAGLEPKKKKMKESFSNWRNDLNEVMSDVEDDKEVKEKKIKNKITINPKLGEAVENLGGELLEVQDLGEKINLKKDDMGDVIKDFYKSDAPQFKGRSKEKRREMAIAAKLTAERGGRKIDEKKGCAHTHKGEECPVHGVKECPDNLDERTRYAKETGKDFTTGKPSEKGGTRTGTSTFDKVSREMRKTGGVMSARGKGIQPQGKKKVPGKKGYQGVTPVDRIRNRLAQKRAAKPNPYKARAGESD